MAGGKRLVAHLFSIRPLLTLILHPFPPLFLLFSIRRIEALMCPGELGNIELYQTLGMDSGARNVGMSLLFSFLLHHQLHLVLLCVAFHGYSIFLGSSLGIFPLLPCLSTTSFLFGSWIPIMGQTVLEWMVRETHT